MASPSPGTISITGVNPNALIKVYQVNGTEVEYRGLIGAGSDGTVIRPGFVIGTYYVTQVNEDSTLESAPSNTVTVQ